MEEIKEGDNKKSNAAIILLAIILSLAIIGIVFWLVFKFLISGVNDNSMPNIPDIPEARASCLQNSDCVLVSKYYTNQYGQSACCPMNCEQEVINIETKTKEAAERDKLCATKKYQCPKSEQCVTQPLKEAVCEQSRCVAKEKTVNDNFNANNNTGAESPTGIYLEQKEYKAGENITGVIRNSKNPEMFVKNISVEKLSFSDCDESVGNVETKDCVQRGWKVIKYDIGCRGCAVGVKCETAKIGVSPHNIHEFSWNQSTDEVSVGAIIDEDDKPACITADAGKYRIKAAYYMYDSMIGANQSSDSIYIYSNEFTIADKTVEQSSNNNVNIGNGNQNNNNNSSVNNSPDKYKIIGSLDSPGESSFVEAVGNIVFMSDISEGLLSIDATDPQKPEIMHKLKIGGGGAYALATDILNGNHALVSGYANTKVALVDFVDPENLKQIDEIDAQWSVQSAVWYKNYGYLALAEKGIEIIKLEDRKIKSQGVISIPDGGRATALAIALNDHEFSLVAALGDGGVSVYGLTDPSSPKLNIDIRNIGYASAAALKGGYVYAGIDHSIKVVDKVSQKIVKDAAVGQIWDMRLSGDFLYVGSGEEGVRIVDISDQVNPKQIALIDTPGRTRDLALDIGGNYIYVADDANDLQIIGKQ